MPTYLEKSDYDLFEYDYENSPLTLEDAIKRAKELQSKSDGSVFYRVIPTNNKGTEFRVVDVPKSEVFADFMNKFAQWVSRFTLARRFH